MIFGGKVYRTAELDFTDVMKNEGVRKQGIQWCIETSKDRWFSPELERYVSRYELARIHITNATPTGVEAEVCVDIAERQRMGIEKYGTSLAENQLPLPAWLKHTYEELLDAALYIKRYMTDKDWSKPEPKQLDMFEDLGE